jgi:predicted transcriptional regulator
LDAGKTPDWAGATTILAKGLWPKDHRGRSSPSRFLRDRVLPARGIRKIQAVIRDVRGTTGEEEKNDMAIIKAPPKQPKSVTIQARVEESVKTQLDQYAKFIDSTPSYVITEALKVLFKRDDEFKAWQGQHANDQNSVQYHGKAFTKTA